MRDREGRVITYQAGCEFVPQTLLPSGLESEGAGISVNQGVLASGLYRHLLFLRGLPLGKDVFPY